MPKVNVSGHFSMKTGEMYLPSQPWGIHYWQLGIDTSLGGDSARNKQVAMERAQAWCNKQGRSAEIFRRRDGKVVMRYWMDAVGLQFLRF